MSLSEGFVRISETDHWHRGIIKSGISVGFCISNFKSSKMYTVVYPIFKLCQSQHLYFPLDPASKKYSLEKVTKNENVGKNLHLCNGDVFSIYSSGQGTVDQIALLI